MTFKFFITPVYPYGNDHYYHEIITLAEGFKELGHKILGNVSYWKVFNSNSFLIEKSDEEDFDVGVYDYRYVKSFEHLLFRSGYPNFDRKKIHVLVDRNDWISPIWKKNHHYQIFDLILGCHTVKGFNYPKNYMPWAMGLSNRMIKEIDKCSDQEIKNEIGHNFRVWHNLRKFFIQEINQNESLFPVKEYLTTPPEQNDDSEIFYNYLRTTRRHNPIYYKIINSTLLFMGFGGYVETYPKLFQPYGIMDKIRRKPYYILSKKNKDKYSYVFQWDSFRMWELFYAKTCPIFLNFQKFKFQLPVEPTDEDHYMGINNFSWSAFNNKLKKYNEKNIQEIGSNGKKWVFENYSPKPTALRLLSKI